MRKSLSDLQTVTKACYTLSLKFQELETDFKTIKAIQYDRVRLEDSPMRETGLIYVERKNELLSEAKRLQERLNQAQSDVRDDIKQLLPERLTGLAESFFINGLRGKDLADSNNLTMSECRDSMSQIFDSFLS